MKKNIKEQSKAPVDPGMTNVINAPKGELDILQTNGFLRNKGVLSNLALYPDGSPKVVRVKNRKYYAAKKYDRPGKESLYLTYDGRILVKISDGVYKYKLDPNTNQPYLIDGIADTGLQLQYTNVLTQFGLNPDDPETDVYAYLKEVTKKLQEYIDKGAVSNLFQIWNDMLTYYYPNTYKTEQLKVKKGSDTFRPTVDSKKLNTEYDKLTDIERFGNLSFQGKDFPIYMPKGVAQDTTFKKREGKTAEECRAKVLQYLGTAMDWQMNGGSINPTLQQYKVDIGQCNTAGAYDDFSGVTKDELNKFVDFSDERSPFGFFKMGTTLSWDQVAKILAGRAKRVLKSPNPYIIGDSILESTEDKLKSLIKENLITLSEEKKNKLLGESNIINTRFQIIKESKITDDNKLFNDVISEMFYMNSQGFDKGLINEGFWDVLKGLFPSTDIVAEWFKEKMTTWLIEAIAPGKENSWIANILITSIGNLNIGDIPKLTNCDFTTKLLSKSISEAVIRKFAKSQGISGVIPDLIRNTMVDHLDNTEFAQKLESGLSHIICPLLGGVAQKMSTVADTMKDKAIAA
jgi:hypothetical protein